MITIIVKIIFPGWKLWIKTNNTMYNRLLPFLVLFSLPNQWTCDSSHIAHCRSIYTSCDKQDVLHNDSSLYPSQGKSDVTITTIVPLTECFAGKECKIVDFRLLDLLGLQVAITSLTPPDELCVELELCDSFHDPIAAGRILGSFNFRESCDSTTCNTDEVCFSQTSKAKRNHVAIIGPGTPREGKSVADMTAALGLPQLLYSTGSHFDDPDRFYYLHQFAPRYQLQVSKIVEIIGAMSWRYVAILSTADTYGDIGYELLKKEFEKIHMKDEGLEKNCCLQFSTKMVTFKMGQKDIEAQLRGLEDRVKVIIMWMEGQYAEKVLSYFKRSGRKESVYIASDGWSINTQILKRFRTMLTDRFIGIFPDFGDDINNEIIRSKNFYNDVSCHNSSVFDKEGCKRAKKLVQDHQVFGYSGGIISSLRSLYTALNASSSLFLDPRDFRNNVNENLHWQANASTGNVQVYTLLQGVLKRSRDMTSYPQGIVSTCSDDCAPGQYQVLLKKSPRCCFTCKSCPDNSIVVPEHEHEKCDECPHCLRPSPNRTSCVPKEVDKFSILNGDPFSVSVFVVSCVGILCNMFVMGTLIRNSDTPIVKASSPQLCYIMLVSLMVLLTAPILMVSGPGDTTCPSQRYIIGLGTVIPIAVLFARTNRINVIFNRRSLLTSQLQKMVMSIKYNILLVGFFAAIQFCICLALHVHHEQKIDNQTQHIKTFCSLDVNENNFVMCNESRMDLVYVWIGYVCLMIFATTVVAYKTRRLPTNFNEARYICLVMFVVTVLTISTISTYIMLQNQENIMYQCWSIIVAVYSILGIIYGQKMYVIYVIPEANTRCDTNIALKKFIKQDSDQRNTSSSYSQLLIRHPRHLSVETTFTSQPLLSRQVSSQNGKSATAITPSPTAKPRAPLAFELTESAKPNITKTTSAPSSSLEKMTVAERRARFRKGYVRKGKLVKTMSEGRDNKRLLVRDERLVGIKSEGSRSSDRSTSPSIANNSSATDSVSVTSDPNGALNT